MERELTTSGCIKPKFSKVLPLNPKHKDVDEIICRICMDGEIKSSPLITPCNCSGSVKYVHESCLKIWITSHSIQINTAYCEICKNNFVIDQSYTKICSLSLLIQHFKSHLILFSILFTIMFSLFTLIYLLANKNITLGGKKKSIMYSIGLMIICAIGGIFIFFIIFVKFKSICCKKRLKNWRILSRDIKSNECIEIRNETLIIENGKENEILNNEIEPQESVNKPLGTLTERVKNEDNLSLKLNLSSEMESPKHSPSKSLNARNRAYSDPLTSI